MYRRRHCRSRPPVSRRGRCCRAAARVAETLPGVKARCSRPSDGTLPILHVVDVPGARGRILNPWARRKNRSAASRNRGCAETTRTALTRSIGSTWTMPPRAPSLCACSTFSSSPASLTRSRRRPGRRRAGATGQDIDVSADQPDQSLPHRGVAADQQHVAGAVGGDLAALSDIGLSILARSPAAA